MADTRVQTRVEDWVRRHWMPEHLGEAFHRDRLVLRSGGVFDFDAVSEGATVVASISTSSARTARGSKGVGKLMKLRSDMLFLTMVEATRRLIILTERDMYDACLQEQEGGRVPPEITFLHAEIPEDLASELRKAKARASSEVTPDRRGGMPPS